MRRTYVKNLTLAVRRLDDPLGRGPARGIPAYRLDPLWGSA